MNAEDRHAVIEFFDQPPKSLDDIAQAHPEEITVLNASAFNASDPGTTVALIVLTSVVVKAVAGVVREHIAAKKHVTVKVDGIEVTGVSGEDAAKIVADLAGRPSGE